MNRSLLYPRATTTRRLIGLDGMWRFSFDPESKGANVLLSHFHSAHHI